MVYQSKVSGEGKKKCFASARCWCDIEDVDHSWVDDVDAVVEL